MLRDDRGRRPVRGGPGDRYGTGWDQPLVWRPK